ncbi:MAG: MogA/MoaB family molybdenum cofactor biosynthesis protein [Acidobacteria bacterium]|nr:MAG: MogA/MoaB family molybdenum cofactor biosynthesis protein [Acidobacteriota bacterium]REK01272.1 MAG: MogA/MoaB family molybdenum cofactor biosynthesis protein [Acidobacteriota bacterium]REK14228.1 MAG: MogA/MoaB family molybdenum cofactor biosynthesis protein [Acidobacteriota bacterium]REK44943.1 MAG: MogA/MoaB family molybdenum cofactor biosynthesis protein [Acidobacteriota bacterium]
MGTDGNIIAAVVTVSDTRTTENDLSGKRLADLLSDFGALIVERQIVNDDYDNLRNALYALAEREDVNLIITTGGTGLAERDNTPEATHSIIQKEAPGIAEAIRAESFKITPTAMLSRGTAGVRNGTLIINLPGSEKGVAETFEVIRPILRHAVDLVSGKTEH